MTDATVTMYGADWCLDCVRSKKLLESLEVPFTYVNLIDTPEEADTAEAISGRKNIPVVVFPDGSHLVEPTDPQLRASLEANSLI